MLRSYFRNVSASMVRTKKRKKKEVEELDSLGETSAPKIFHQVRARWRSSNVFNVSSTGHYNVQWTILIVYIYLFSTHYKRRFSLQTNESSDFLQTNESSDLAPLRDRTWSSGEHPLSITTYGILTIPWFNIRI